MVNKNDDLIECIASKFYGNTIPTEICSLIDKMINDYNFSENGIHVFFDIGYKMDPTLSFLFLEKQANILWEKGYTDASTINMYFERYEQALSLVNYIEGELKRVFGLGEFDRAIDFFERYKFSLELVEQAITQNRYRLDKYNNPITIDNILDTLTEFSQHNVKTSEDSVRYAEEKRERNLKNKKRNTTYSKWPTGEEAGIVSKNKEENFSSTITDDHAEKIEAILRDLEE